MGASLHLIQDERTARSAHPLRLLMDGSLHLIPDERTVQSAQCPPTQSIDGWVVTFDTQMRELRGVPTHLGCWWVGCYIWYKMRQLRRVCTHSGYWWVGCYIRYKDEGTQQSASPLRPFMGGLLRLVQRWRNSKEFPLRPIFVVPNEAATVFVLMYNASYMRTFICQLTGYPVTYVAYGQIG